MNTLILPLNLLLLFVFLFGGAISVILWLSYRDALYKKMLFFWLANIGHMFLFPVVKKISGESLVTEGMVALSWMGATLIPLLISIVQDLNQDFRWKRPIIFSSLLGIIATLVTSHLTQNFMFSTLIGGILETVPLILLLIYLQFLKQGQRPSSILSGFNITALFLLLHFLDYPFLRTVESFAPFGFTIYVGISVGLVVFMQGLMVERLYQANAEDLKHKVEERTHELEAFSYSVSHDLRAPLRAIDGFSKILFEQNSGLTNEAQNCLSRIRYNTQKMGQLIDDLLSFSRLGHHSLMKRKIDSSILVKQTLEEFRDEIEGRHIEIYQNSLPPCHGDPILLKQVWVNLLSNAIKYTKKKDHAVIEIGTLLPERTKDVIYFVKDNGVGFDMHYSDKLFGVFQRLHPTEDFEGTGVGLAIVKRVIERHGGRVWANAETNEGATFYFTLQKEHKI